MTDATIPTGSSSSRRTWASLAFWLLLVIWVMVFGALGYALQDAAAVSALLGIRTDHVVGALLLAAAVVGQLAFGVGRSR